MLMLDIPDWAAFSSFPLVELIADWASVRKWVGVHSIRCISSYYEAQILSSGFVHLQIQPHALDTQSSIATARAYFCGGSTTLVLVRMHT